MPVASGCAFSLESGETVVNVPSPQTNVAVCVSSQPGSLYLIEAVATPVNGLNANSGVFVVGAMLLTVILNVAVPIPLSLSVTLTVTV